MKVQVAVVNGPSNGHSCRRYSGIGRDHSKSIEKEGIFVRWLRIDYAFHTHQMDPIKE